MVDMCLYKNFNIVLFPPLDILILVLSRSNDPSPRNNPIIVNKSESNEVCLPLPTDSNVDGTNYCVPILILAPLISGHCLNGKNP